MGQKDEKPIAKLVGKGKMRKIEIRVDANTIVTRKIKEDDNKRYPFLFSNTKKSDDKKSDEK